VVGCGYVALLEEGKPFYFPSFLQALSEAIIETSAI
jgi:hypothetical protein